MILVNLFFLFFYFASMIFMVFDLIEDIKTYKTISCQVMKEKFPYSRFIIDESKYVKKIKYLCGFHLSISAFTIMNLGKSTPIILLLSYIVIFIISAIYTNIAINKQFTKFKNHIVDKIWDMYLDKNAQEYASKN